MQKCLPASTYKPSYGLLQEKTYCSVQFSSVQFLSPVRLFAIPRTPACQTSLSIANSQSLLKLIAFESVMPSISSSVVPFSSCPQSLPASESFPMSQLFT